MGFFCGVVFWIELRNGSENLGFPFGVTYQIAKQSEDKRAEALLRGVKRRRETSHMALQEKIPLQNGFFLEKLIYKDENPQGRLCAVYDASVITGRSPFYRKELYWYSHMALQIQTGTIQLYYKEVRRRHEDAKYLLGSFLVSKKSFLY